MDSIQEQAKLLLSEDKPKRIETLRAAFTVDPRGAFHLGVRLQLSAKDALSVLDSTIECSDSSTIQWWLEFYAAVAGGRRLTQFLDNLEMTSIELFEKAMYWVPNLASIRGPGDIDILNKWLEQRRKGET